MVIQTEWLYDHKQFPTNTIAAVHIKGIYKNASINAFIFYFEWLTLEGQYGFREYLLTELAHV